MSCFRPRWIGSAALAATLVVVASGLSRSWDGPWGMLPGGALRGPERPCRVQWSGAGPRELELEVRPDRPRSVTTWSVTHGGRLYVPADFLTPFKRWPHQVAEDDRVRLRWSGSAHACRLRRVHDSDEVRELRQRVAEKYEIEPEGRAARVEVWWFEVVSR